MRFRKKQASAPHPEMSGAAPSDDTAAITADDVPFAVGEALPDFGPADGIHPVPLPAMEGDHWANTGPQWAAVATPDSPAQPPAPQPVALPTHGAIPSAVLPALPPVASTGDLSVAPRDDYEVVRADARARAVRLMASRDALSDPSETYRFSSEPPHAADALANAMGYPHLTSGWVEKGPLLHGRPAREWHPDEIVTQPVDLSTFVLPLPTVPSLSFYHQIHQMMVDPGESVEPATTLSTIDTEQAKAAEPLTVEAHPAAVDTAVSGADASSVEAFEGSPTDEEAFLLAQAVTVSDLPASEPTSVAPAEPVVEPVVEPVALGSNDDDAEPDWVNTEPSPGTQAELDAYQTLVAEMQAFSGIPAMPPIGPTVADPSLDAAPVQGQD